MKIALLSNNIIWESAHENLKVCEELVENLFDKNSNVNLIIFPEFFSTGFSMNPEQSEEMNGLTISWMFKIAKKYSSAILASVPVKEDNRYYNRAIFIKPDGELSYYNKRHLFRFGGEDKLYSHGDRHLIVNYLGINIGIQICYDLRFPVWARNRELSYDILINIANWPDKRADVINPLCRARAIENLSYFAFLNRSGSDPGNSYNGERYLFNYYGEEVTPIANDEYFSLFKIEVDNLRLYREKFQVWRDADEFTIIK